MERLLNVATPAAALRDKVPASVPTPGLAPIATVMLAPLDVIVLPPASWTVTVTAGVIATLATVFVGCVPKASLLGVPTVMLNELLVAPVRPVAVAESV